MCVCVCVCVCGWCRGLDRPRVHPLFLLQPSAPALACWGFITGAGWLPRRLGFSCMCTAWLPVVPVVGAAPLCLCLVPRWHRVRCDVRVVCWLDASTAAWSGIGVGGLPFVARVALLACVGGLTLIVRVCIWWFPALVPACLCIPHHRVSLQHLRRQTVCSLSSESFPAGVY